LKKTKNIIFCRNFEISTYRYKSSELFVFGRFQFDIFAACFLFEAVFSVWLEYLVKLCSTTQNDALFDVNSYTCYQ